MVKISSTINHTILARLVTHPTATVHQTERTTTSFAHQSLVITLEDVIRICTHTHTQTLLDSSLSMSLVEDTNWRRTPSLQRIATTAPTTDTMTSYMMCLLLPMTVMPYNCMRTHSLNSQLPRLQPPREASGCPTLLIKCCELQHLHLMRLLRFVDSTPGYGWRAEGSRALNWLIANVPSLRTNTNREPIFPSPVRKLQLRRERKNRPRFPKAKPSLHQRSAKWTLIGLTFANDLQSFAMGGIWRVLYCCHSKGRTQTSFCIERETFCFFASEASTATHWWTN